MVIDIKYLNCNWDLENVIPERPKFESESKLVRPPEHSHM